MLEAIDRGELKLTDNITASETALHGLPADGSTANIKVGETLTVEQLLNCMLIVSANEACNILAEAVCGSVDTFVARMNERAAQLGCEHTHYVNTSGLHNANHYSSAWDIYLITCEALKHDLFLTICNSKSYEVPATNMTEKSRVLHSTNYLISNWRANGYLYRDAQGIKTGSTPEAGYCLVSSAVRGNRTLLSVVLGADRREDADGVTWTYSFIETSRLFDWGFDNFVNRKILSSAEPICEIPVTLSGETNYVVVHPAEDLMRMVPNDLEIDSLDRTVKLYRETVEAPIAAGDELGTLTLSCGDTLYGEVPLLALSDVSASWLLVAKRDVAEVFSLPVVRIISFLVMIGVVLFAVITSRRNRRSSRRRGSSQRSYRGERK